MLCVLGITMVGVLTGSRPVQGITAAVLGLVMATTGGGPGAAEMRYTFGLPYLFDGIPVVIVALGMFGLPETLDILIQGTTISERATLGKGMLEGIKDVFRNWFLMLRCSALGAYIGFIPGIGGTVATWLAYGHAAQSCKGASETFGKGDVRGVIGPESANNAKCGGAFIPTILFGIPGSTSMALVLMALMVLEVYPGPDMLTKNLDFTFVIIWSLAISNVVAAGTCLLLVRPLAKLTTVRVHYWVPFIILLVLLGAYQATRNWGDLIVLLLLGILGWTMKRNSCPRPPLVIGFVLGKMAETYLYHAVKRWKAAWLLHPGVVIIGLFIIFSLYMGLRWQKGRAGKSYEE